MVTTSQIRPGLVENLLNLASVKSNTKKLAKSFDLEAAICQIEEHLHVLDYKLSCIILVGLSKVLKEHSVSLLRVVKELLQRVSDQTLHLNKDVSKMSKSSRATKRKSFSTSVQNFEDTNTIATEKVQEMINDNFLDSLIGNDFSFFDQDKLRENQEKFQEDFAMMSPMTPMPLNDRFNMDQINKMMASPGGPDTAHEIPDLDFQQPDVPDLDMPGPTSPKMGKFDNGDESSLFQQRSRVMSNIFDQSAGDHGRTAKSKPKGVTIDKHTEIASSMMKTLISNAKTSCRKLQAVSSEFDVFYAATAGSTHFGCRSDDSCAQLSDSMLVLKCFKMQMFTTGPTLNSDTAFGDPNETANALRDFFDRTADSLVMRDAAGNKEPQISDLQPVDKFQLAADIPDVEPDLPDFPTGDFHQPPDIDDLPMNMNCEEEDLLGGFEILNGNTASKRVAASKFSELLVLLSNPACSHSASQNEPFGAIVVSCV